MLTEVLSEVLSEHYALSNVRLTPAPRGWVAETYYVDSDSGRVFAKLVTGAEYSDTLVRSLPVLEALAQLGIQNITVPIPTTSGALSVALDDQVLVLFQLVPGTKTFDFPLEPFVRLLASIHLRSHEVEAILPREMFNFGVRARMMARFERFYTETFDHPHTLTLQSWLIDQRAELERDLAAIDAAGVELASRQQVFILTHGDTIGNVLCEGEHVAIVDWDTVMLAPPERDTWFYVERPDFLPLYRESVPGYTVDMTAYRYYLLLRYFEDLDGYMDRMLDPERTDDERAQMLEYLRITYDEWLGPMIARDRTR